MAGNGAEAPKSYFTCTLGEAAQYHADHPHPYRTISKLLDARAMMDPKRAAVGVFRKRRPASGGETLHCNVYDFQRLREDSLKAATHLHHQFGSDAQERTVALIGRSTESFLLSWLGLVQMGYSVLLLSPQLGSEAVAHLCQECGTSRLVYEEASCRALALSSQTQCHEQRLKIYGFPGPGSSPINSLGAYESSTSPVWTVSELDIAYFHHTSGTSGSLPKLLPVSHRMAVGALPSLRGDPSANATFSTTPLYHGGVADCFRAWAALSMIWIFPGELPVTAANIQRCIRLSNDAFGEGVAPKLIYFSCVPQVLAFLAASEEGMSTLKAMEMVGVGGAPMTEGLATRLVDEDVNLLSRFGTTECGFLLSSDRPYAEDKAWQFLRHNPHVSAITFESREEGLSELVVRPEWPALAYQNRPDGSYATADLFTPHPTIPNAWKHHSRSDAQLTLATGKKFDPAPFEDSIRESVLLDDILIFGNDRPFPGALLFRSHLAGDISEQQILNELWPLIYEKNAQSPSHARLDKSMLTVIPASITALPKSSKGTTLRKQAEFVWKMQIEDAYSNEKTLTGSLNNDSKSLSPEADNKEISKLVLEIIASIVGSVEDLSPNDDFYNFGIDSSACIKIRAKIQTRLIPPDRPQLPLNVVYDCGTIAELSEFIRNARQGIQQSSDDEINLMKHLVAKYGDWPESQDYRNSDISLEENAEDMLGSSYDLDVVVITGVTGALGAHLLSKLRSLPSLPEIHCLIRASTSESARGRVSESLLQRHLPPLDVARDRIHYHPCELSQPHLGLDDSTFLDIARRVTHVIHAAWAVNFTMRLSSFVKDHIIGLHYLIKFALASYRSKPPRFIFCSSTASVIKTHGISNNVPERILCDPHAPSEMGYARSKWVAELICQQAHMKTRLYDNINVLRIGQLCGDSKRGVWNVTEAWPLMLSSSQATGSLPDLGNELLSWLPVDTAAQAVLEIALSSHRSNATKEIDDQQNGKSQGNWAQPCPVYNLMNPSRETTWSDLLIWLRKMSPEIHIVRPDQWVAQLASLPADSTNHPAQKLLGLWKKAYAPGTIDKVSERLIFDMVETKTAAPVMRDVPPVGEAQFRLIWEWINEEMMGQGSLPSR